MSCESGEAYCRKDRKTVFSDAVSARGVETKMVRGRLLSV